jgi:hypothetical protein
MPTRKPRVKTERVLAAGLTRLPPTISGVGRTQVLALRRQRCPVGVDGVHTLGSRIGEHTPCTLRRALVADVDCDDRVALGCEPLVVEVAMRLVPGFAARL